MFLTQMLLTMFLALLFLPLFVRLVLQPSLRASGRHRPGPGAR